MDPSATPPDEHAFTCEAWSPVLAVASLPGPPDPSAFLPAAARFCNERLWGTLSASVFCHPADMAADPPAFDRFLADMRYGSVGVNTLSALNFSINKLPWGAYPGHTLADIQSGVGQARAERGSSSLFGFSCRRAAHACVTLIDVAE